MKKKIILLVVLVAILVGIGVSYAYFATDMFKTEKEMFFSYALGMHAKYEADELEEKLTEYLSKKNNTAFTNDGEVTFNMEGTVTADEQAGLDMLNNSKVTFQGKTNPNDKLAEQTITLDFGQGVNIPVEFKRDRDVYGIQTDLLDSRFIAIRNENLQALAQRFELEVEGLPDKIEFENAEFTEEELNILKDKYLTLLNDNLEDELFSKEEIDGQKVIKLSMTGTKAKDVIKKLLETLRNDEIILGKLPVASKDKLLESIDDLNSELDSEIREDGKVEIKVYVEDRQTKKCELVVFAEDEYEEAKVLIEGTENNVAMKVYAESELVMDITTVVEKNENDVTIKADVTLLEEGVSVVECAINMTYKNLLTLDNVEENVDIKIAFDNADDITDGEKGEINVVLKNKITFAPDTQIERFNEENSIVINDTTDQELQTLLLSIYQKLGLI